MRLRPYQTRALDAVQNAWTQADSVCLVCPTGGGKTFMGTRLALQQAGAHGRVLWVAHRRELVSQAMERIQGQEGITSFDVAPILSNRPLRKGARIQVGTVQTILARNLALDADVLVMDECFPGWTQIDTPAGDRKISDIRSGDSVLCYDHDEKQIVSRRVTATRKHTPDALVLIRHEHGGFVCTPNHPIFTQRGYVQALELTKDDVCYLLPTNYRHKEDMLTSVPQRGPLQDSEPNQQGPRIRAHEEKEPHAQGRRPVKGWRNAQDNGTQANGTGRQRSGDDGATGAAVVRDTWDRAGIHPAHRSAASPWGTNTLQGGPGDAEQHVSNRGGRWIAQFPASQRGGPEEDRIFRVSRVESVEVHKPRSDGEFESLCPDSCVYNLEVEEHANYFAGRTLVHNCHHYVSDHWKQLHDAYPNAKALGLTATPQRSDGVPLGDIFDRLVVGAQYSELIADGHLCEAVTYRPPDQLSGALAVDPLSAWEMYAQGQRAFVFLSSVKLAKEWTEKFNAEGIAAECITGKSSNRARADALARFRDGTTMVLVNVDVLTEGVDVPEATACILGRAFNSVGTYMQAAGRVLRPHESKRRAIIIDLTGCSHKHGLATEDRFYSLEGEGIRRANDDDLTVRNCLKCGVVYETPAESCPACGTKPPPRTAKPPKIYSMELQEVWDGERTPDNAKAKEKERLIGVARSRGWSFQWVLKEYKKTFGEDTVIKEATKAERRDELTRLRASAAERGYKPGYASARYKGIFGVWP